MQIIFAYVLLLTSWREFQVGIRKVIRQYLMTTVEFWPPHHYTHMQFLFVKTVIYGQRWADVIAQMH